MRSAIGGQMQRSHSPYQPRNYSCPPMTDACSSSFLASGRCCHCSRLMRCQLFSVKLR